MRATGELDVLLLGPVPPPFGGISVHVSRVAALLSRAGFRVGVLNHFSATDPPFVVGTLKRSPLRYYRLPRRFPAHVVHYHHSRWPHLIAFSLGRPNGDARYILTLHAGDLRKHFPQLISHVPFVSRLTRWSLRRFDVIITVDAEIAAAIRERTHQKQVEVLPAFVASTNHEHGPYEPSLESFVSSGRVLVAAAYGVQFLKGGRELYGLDTAVEAFIALGPPREDVRLALFIARRPSRRKAKRHLQGLERRLAEAGIAERVYIVFGAPLLPALRPNTIFVRPTRAEGDAVSVREAQAAGVPVVASDVVPRPAGVVTFSVGSASHLSAALQALLDHPAASSIPVAHAASDGDADVFFERLIALYRSQLAVH